MIWEAAANLPRYLDIWARPTGEAFYVDEEDQTVEKVKTFRFTTRQSIPGFLLATRESKAATRKFFHLSSGISHDYSNPKMSIRPEILRNFNADRICPMGPYTEEADTEM
jgi:hypothetical protein